MTEQELHINLEQSLQNLTSYTYDDVQPEEIDIALNKCILRKIDRVLENTSDLGFAGNSPNFNKIRNLVKEQDALIYISTKEGSQYLYQLPIDYFREIRFKVYFTTTRICKNPYTGKEENKPFKGDVRIISSQEVEEALDDSLRKTSKDSIVASIIDNAVYLYTNFSRTDIQRVKLRYIKYPKVFNLRQNGNVEYPMPKDFLEDLADETALHLAKVIEAEQKAKLLTSENIN